MVFIQDSPGLPVLQQFLKIDTDFGTFQCVFVLFIDSRYLPVLHGFIKYSIGVGSVVW
jgi:hypothetical protein